MASVRVTANDSDDTLFYRRSFLLGGWLVLIQDSNGVSILKERMGYYIHGTSNKSIIEILNQPKGLIMWEIKWEYLGMVDGCTNCKATGLLDWLERVRGKKKSAAKRKRNYKLSISKRMIAKPKLVMGDMICPICNGAGIMHENFIPLIQTKIIDQSVSSNKDVFDEDEMALNNINSLEDAIYIDKFVDKGVKP